MDLQLVFLWICCLIGLTNTRHLQRTTGVGTVGESLLSIDPLVASQIIASRASPSSTQSRATVRRRPSITLDALRMRRRRAFIANVNGQLVLIVPSATRRGRTRTVNPRINQVSLSMRTLPVNGVRSSIGVVSPQIQAAPPGVQFLGGAGQTGGNIVYLDNTQIAGQVASIPGSGVRSSVVTGSGRKSLIPNSNLQISGINQKGDLIITGPGGSITIGTDLLNGISRKNSMPLFTEFEEIELEGQNQTAANGNPNRVALSQQGKGTIIIERAPQISAVNPINTLQTGSGEVASAASSSASSSASAGGASASSSAASSASGASSSASSSAASSSAGGASSSASSSSVSLGNGISLEKGGQLIRLGQNGGKTQTITLGGSPGRIQLADGGSGIQVPGNATFIVGG